MGSPNDITNLNISQSSASLTLIVVQGFIITPDGLNLYFIAIDETFVNNRVFHYTMSSAWDLSTLSFLNRT